MTNLPRITITVPDEQTKVGLQGAAKVKKKTISDLLLPKIREIIKQPKKKPTNFRKGDRV